MVLFSRAQTSDFVKNARIGLVEVRHGGDYGSAAFGQIH